MKIFFRRRNAKINKKNLLLKTLMTKLSINRKLRRQSKKNPKNKCFVKKQKQYKKKRSKNKKKFLTKKRKKIQIKVMSINNREDII